MEGIARSYLSNGDVAAAAKLLSSLEVTQPKVSKLARCCRVLADPASVPVPHRFSDIAEALLDASMPIEAYFGPLNDADDALRRYNKLLLLVHPDKNPYPRAGEAFHRLKTLRDQVLTAVEEKRKSREEAALANSQYARLSGTPPPPVHPPSSRVKKEAEPIAPKKPQKSQLPKVSAKKGVETHPPRQEDSTAAGTLPAPPVGGEAKKSKQPTAVRSGNAPKVKRDAVVTPRSELHGVISELKNLKSTKLKLQCSFGDVEDTQDEANNTHCYNNEEDEELLACTVSSTISNGTLPSLGGSKGGSGATALSSSFTVRGGRSDCMIEHLVVQQGIAASSFATDAKASTLAVWDEYRRSRQPSTPT